jgi:hypothetical protein
MQRISFWARFSSLLIVSGRRIYPLEVLVGKGRTRQSRAACAESEGRCSSICCRVACFGQLSAGIPQREQIGICLVLPNSLSIYGVPLPTASPKRFLNRLVICITKETPADHQTRGAPEGERKRVRPRFLNARGAPGSIDPRGAISRKRTSPVHCCSTMCLLLSAVACAGPSPKNN